MHVLACDTASQALLSVVALTRDRSLFETQIEPPGTESVEIKWDFNEE